MNEELTRQLRALIDEPVTMIELLTSGALRDSRPPVAEVICHPGTPIVIEFKSATVVFSCKSGAHVDVQIVPKDFNPAMFFQDDPVLHDQECFVVRIPLHHFVEGPHGNCFNDADPYLDSVSLIYRNLGEKWDGLAAVILAFHDSTHFGFSAVHESHFSFIFNDFCVQLLRESLQSPNHRVDTVARSEASPRPIESLLWLVE